MGKDDLVDAPATAGVVVVDSRRDILTVGHPTFGVSLPGGHIEPGETPAQAAVREVHEESGVTCQLLSEEPFTYTRTAGAPTCAWFVATAHGLASEGAAWVPRAALVLPFAGDADLVDTALTLLGP